MNAALSQRLTHAPWKADAEVVGRNWTRQSVTARDDGLCLRPVSHPPPRAGANRRPGPVHQR